MPTAKAAAKKAVKKTPRKPAPKATLDDVWAAMRELQELQKKAQENNEKAKDEAWVSIRETQAAHRETEKAIRETQAAHRETEQAIRETQAVHRETEQAIRETQAAHKETEKANKETRKLADEAWAAIRETQAAHKETEQAIKETEKANKETRKLADEAWAAIRETQKNIGGLNNTLGSLVERIMTPGLPQKFTQFGFTFDKISTVKWAVEGNIYAEIDGLLENGKQAMAVEVKTTLEIADINDHLKRMERIRKYADDHGDKREFLGAMAATITSKKTKDYALANGLFVIEPSGEDVKITKPPAAPKVW